MKIAWTTTETLEQAQCLARGTIEKQLAACAQISSPIHSIYQWQGKVEDSTEYRITFKYPKSAHDALEAWVLENHPYDTPQWLAVEASDVLEAYQAWSDGAIS